MSNFLGVATVTAALQELLQRAVGSDVPGAHVRTDRPDATRDGTPIVNVFLYHVGSNAALRNADLPTRRSDGSTLQRPRAAVDLHYLVSFYGNDNDFVPQRLLGSATAALHAHPVISKDLIDAVVAGATASPTPMHPALALTDLADDEPVRLCPHPLDLEQLSKLWSVMFQTPYALSTSWQASVVLLERDVPVVPAAPVLTSVLSVAPTSAPRIDRVVGVPAGAPITMTSKIQIVGQALLSTNVAVRVGTSELLPTRVGSSSVDIDLATAPAGQLRAGTLPVLVIHRRVIGDPPSVRGEITSNSAPLLLRPDITAVSVAAGHVTIVTDVTVGAHQSVEVVLVDPTTGSVMHRQTLADRISDGTSLDASTSGVVPGTYGVVVHVDGAASEPRRNAGGTITAPTVVIP